MVSKDNGMYRDTIGITFQNHDESIIENINNFVQQGNMNVSFENRNIVEDEDVVDNEHTDRREDFIESIFVVERDDSNSKNSYNNKKRKWAFDIISHEFIYVGDCRSPLILITTNNSRSFVIMSHLSYK